MNEGNSVFINLTISDELSCLPELSRNEGSYKVSNSFERCPVHGGDDDNEEPVVKEDEWLLLKAF